MTKPVIICIAKLEADYIEEFVRYHIALGFLKIYIYDNEDVPTYAKLLEKYADNICVIHLPGNNYNKGVQYIALDDFVTNHLASDDITHVVHIDIDEFIVLKQHKNISAFIEHFIVGDCAGIGINWRFFGSGGHTKKTDTPVTQRFVMREISGNCHIKTLFDKRRFLSFNTCHDINVEEGYYIKNTNGTVIVGAFNNDFDFRFTQLNHYKCKTWPEFKYIRTRGRAGLPFEKESDTWIKECFDFFDVKNCLLDTWASDFYQKIVQVRSEV